MAQRAGPDNARSDPRLDSQPGRITQLYESVERIDRWIDGGNATYYGKRHPDTTSPTSPERTARSFARAHLEPATATTDDPMLRVYRGDCLVLMGDIADHPVDLIVSALPYGTSGCPWDTPIDLTALWREYRRIIKPYGPIILFGAKSYTSKIVMSAPKGWFGNEIVWEKNRAASYVHANARPMRVHENIEVFLRGDDWAVTRIKGRTAKLRGGTVVALSEGGRAGDLSPVPCRHLSQNAYWEFVKRGWR
jgi:hypothetical protein